MTWYFRAGLLGCLVGLSPFVAAQADDRPAWDAAYDAAAGTRFIPIELWTGAEWNGGRALELTAARLTFGGARKEISGPIEWTRPEGGQPLLVYSRVNGSKQQLFTVTAAQDGLGRVYDSRYGRDCVDEVKFPLGTWHEGESRTFHISCNGGTKGRTLVVTIEKLDFTFAGARHSLQFHWLADGGREPATDMHYTYSPGRGMVSEVGNE